MGQNSVRSRRVMRSPGFRSTILMLSVGMCCLVLLVYSRPQTETAIASQVLADDNDMRWWRGNLHTHSLWSDGDDYLEMIALWYKERGYDFLSFTDHNVLAQSENWINVEKSAGNRLAYDKLKARFPSGWIEERGKGADLEVRLKKFHEVVEKIADPGKFLLIQAEEISDSFQKRPIHMNVANVQEAIPPLGGESVYEAIQNNTNAVVAQRERTGKPMLVHLNHPNFGWGITAEDLMRVRGENFFEVYNGHPGVNNKGDNLRASTDRIWDIILAHRLTTLNLPMMYGLATDDGHKYHSIPSRRSEPGRGWVMVLAPSLTPAALIEAMEAGRFYASSGVYMERINSEEGEGLEVQVKTEPAVSYTIEFIGTRKDFPTASEPVIDKEGNEVVTTRRYSEDIGTVFKVVEGSHGKYHFNGDELYVRARITSSKVHPNPSAEGDFEQAWIQPVRGPAAVKPEE